MFSLHENGKTWAEMTPEEQKVCLIILGILALALVVYGIYYFLKKKKINKSINCCFSSDVVIYLY